MMRKHELRDILDENKILKYNNHKFVYSNIIYVYES